MNLHTTPLFASVFLLISACALPGTHLYATADKAPSLTAEGIEALEHMGPTLIDSGVNFATYSERATRIDLLLFDDPESSRPTQQFTMTRFGEVWNIFVEGIGLGQHYGYVAWGPNWEEHPDWIPGTIHGFQADCSELGDRFNPNKLLWDPWSKVLHREHDWGKGNAGTGPWRTESTYAAAAKSVVVESGYEWSDNETQWREQRRNPEAPGHGWQDLIIYEAHPKGLTRNESSGVRHPGSFRGIGEMADYFADLGITAVELMPVMEKSLDSAYWGYGTLNFFMPEHTYAADRDPWDVIDEFKWMVDELHKRDIEVIVDIVFNHTGEGGLWRERVFQNLGLNPESFFNLDSKELTTIFSYRGLDNRAWYALGDDSGDPCFYWNNTGVGNQTRTNHRPMRRLQMDSLHWWVEEMHVDGFRFDLAGILGSADLNYNFWAPPETTMVQEVIDDPVLQENNVRIIAEPWIAGGLQGSLIGSYTNSSNRDDVGWYEWGAFFRDWWRRMLNDDNWMLNSCDGYGAPTYTTPVSTGCADGRHIMQGSQGLYGWNGRKPYHAVNYVTSHDGFTLHDLFSYESPLNGCGPLNSTCCDNPTSPWCEPVSGEQNNHSRPWADQDDKRAMIRAAFTAMAVSHGSPMILAGDEWMRTQLGNNNPFLDDNEWQWLRWGEYRADPAKSRMHDFVRQLLHFRQDHGYAFAPTEYGGEAPNSWKDAGNNDLVDYSRRHWMVHYWDSSAGPQLVMAFNFERGTGACIDFTLPPGNWGKVIDTQKWWDSQAYLDSVPEESEMFTRNANTTDPEVVSGSFCVAPNSVVIFEER